MKELFDPLLALLEPASLYEHLMIVMIPAGITVILTPFFNDNVPRVSLVHRPVFTSTKLVIACSMLTAQVVNFGFWCRASLFNSPPSFIAAVLSFLASLIVVVILQSASLSAFPSAAFHNMFLATTLFYDFAMVRHQVTTVGSIGVFQLAFITLKCAFVIMNHAFRTPVVIHQVGQPGEEELEALFRPKVWPSLRRPGIPSLPGLPMGFGMDDLPEPDVMLSSKRLYVHFQRHWRRGEASSLPLLRRSNTNLMTANKKSNKALIKAIMRTMSGTILSGIPLRLCHVLLTLAQPLLLRHILTTTFRGDGSLSTTIFNIVATAIVWVGMGVSAAAHHWEPLVSV